MNYLQPNHLLGTSHQNVNPEATLGVPLSYHKPLQKIEIKTNSKNPTD